MSVTDVAAARRVPEEGRGDVAEEKTGSLGTAKIVAAVVLTSLVLFLVCLFLLPFRRIMPFLQDDAFYYFEIARRIGLGQGSTCDGITKTNGYHPLWLLMLVPLSPIMTASREMGARVAVALAVVLLGGALFLLRAAAATVAPKQAYLALLFSWAALLFSSIFGMESALAALMLAWLLWLIGRRTIPQDLGAGLAVGAVSALLILSRLDSVSYVVALDALWVLMLLREPAGGKRDSEKRDGWQAWAGALVVQAMVIAGYLAVNEVSYGHLLTVSALAKAGRFPGINFAWLRGGLTYVALLSIGLGGVAVWLTRRDQNALAVQVAAVGSLLTLGQIFLRGSFETLVWYWTLPAFCGGLFVAAIAAKAGPRGTAVAWATAVFSLLSLGYGLHLRTHAEATTRYDKALWLAAHAPKNAVFAEPDCGILSYMAERSYLNVDGLTNSFGFQRAIAQDRVPQWLTQAGLNTVVLQAARPPLRTCDGKLIADVRVWRGMSGDLRSVHTVLTPEGPALPGSPYQLWHVVQVLPGRSESLDACTRVSRIAPQ